ncbi:MAG TPA: hypothetical protein VN729_00220 [Ktedonobacteraceae bacterium]|nr:hypothetical protein [Ktedonobacteraceae bacterium]
MDGKDRFQTTIHMNERTPLLFSKIGQKSVTKSLESIDLAWLLAQYMLV